MPTPTPLPRRVAPASYRVHTLTGRVEASGPVALRCAADALAACAALHPDDGRCGAVVVHATPDELYVSIMQEIDGEQVGILDLELDPASVRLLAQHLLAAAATAEAGRSVPT